MNRYEIEKQIKDAVKRYMESAMPVSAVYAYTAFIQPLEINYTTDGHIEITASANLADRRYIAYVRKKYGEVIIEAAGIDKSKVVFKEPEKASEKQTSPTKEDKSGRGRREKCRI